MKVTFRSLGKEIIRNEAIANILGYDKYFKKNSPMGDDFFLRWLRFPGFGFPGGFNFEVKPVENLNYPDKRYKLYEFKTIQSKESALLASWDIGFQSLYSNQYKLIAIDEQSNVKYISGLFICHPIAKDFRLRKNKPDSYLPFLKLKLYCSKYDKISFWKKEKENLIFLCERNADSSKVKASLNPEYPEKLNMEFISAARRMYKDTGIPFKVDLPFKGYDDKRRFIFNALTKNYFLYKIHHTPDIYDKMAIDSATMFYKQDAVALDSFLPSYNEYLSGMEIATVMWRFAKGHCGKAWAPFQSLIFDETGNYILGNTIHPDIEFYRIYKDTVDQLFKRLPNGEIDSPRFFDYYNPDLKREHESYYKRTGHPYPPLDPVFKLYCVGGKWNPCIPYDPPFPEDWQTHLDYYLVALDTKTRGVYFISGRNIYLSKAMHLYSPTSKEPPADIRNWELPYKLAYLRDRLYRYQVAYLGPENITLSDNEKMVLTAVGEERGKAISLKITFFFSRPELLDIEVTNR